MGADLSRVRFDARRDITKVVQQQGRVLLDADGNEQTDALDRRLRAQAADLGSLGPDPDVAGTAVVPRTTPDAFRLTMTGGELSLGRGRMYVDGLLAENHGTGPDELDPLLGGLRGTDATPYLEQPYWPTPDPLPTTGRHLVYLEVRERELTWVEDPGLIDPGIALDTTARAQVVWQVKVHAADVPGLACDTPDDDIPGWTDVIAPPASRLTVGTEPVPVADDFCSLPPSGDYRGLENQTYRVEVHDGGPAGTATFKWSRDNGSVTVPVSEWTSSSRLRLASLGKDTHSLGLGDGQWVEVLDDVHELAGRPGELRQISVDTEDRSISFAPPLPAADWPSTTAAALAVHLRVRRWDGGTGATTVPAGVTAVSLEHGITATLTAGGGQFRTGEHWVFAARTATTSVEELQDAPPLGPHRHFARLGIIEGAAVVSDQCTPLWPPEGGGGEDCACTVCVSVEDHASGTFTIQDALEQVRETGGTVCLEVGTYRLLKPLLLRDGTGVRLRGQGSATRLTADGDALVVTSSYDTKVEDLTIISGDVEQEREYGTAAASIRLVGTVLTSLSGLDVTMRSEREERCAIAVQDQTAGLTVRDCFVAGPVGVRALAGLSSPSHLFVVTITGSRLRCEQVGVQFDAGTIVDHEVRIQDNAFEESRVAGVRVSGEVANPGALQVRGNRVRAEDGHGLVVPAGAMVHDNLLTGADLDPKAKEETTGIAVGSSTLDWEVTTEVRGNVVDSFYRGIDLQVPTSARVNDNQVRSCANGISCSTVEPTADLEVCGNSLSDIGLADEDSADAVVVAGLSDAVVCDNTVRGVGANRITWITGILVHGVASCRMSRNAVATRGGIDGEGRVVDFHLLTVSQALIEGNHSIVDAQRVRRALGLMVYGTPDWARERPMRMRVSETPQHRLVLLDDRLSTHDRGGRQHSVTISSNSFVGAVSAPAIQIGELERGTWPGIRWDGGAVLSHNHCSCPSDLSQGVVQVNALTAVVMGNRVSSGEVSIDVQVDRPVEVPLATVLGNMVDGAIRVNMAPAAGAWAPLNLEVDA